MKKKIYKPRLRELQIELVKFQKDLISRSGKILVILEGRDAAGKDGTIKRLVEHMSPRETRIFAPGIPTDDERRTWYFQRFVSHLPMPNEFLVFNRSWYNRAGVEHVMGFCTQVEYNDFMDSVINFECMLIRSGVRIIKYYLDISKEEQHKRLDARKKDPLSQWKVSPIDGSALAKWDEYSKARNRMLAGTSHPLSPWTIIHADDKRAARIGLINDLLASSEYSGKDRPALDFDDGVAIRWGSNGAGVEILAE